MEIILLIVGALLGVIVGELYRILKTKICFSISQRNMKKRIIAVESTSVNNYLVNYYKLDKQAQFLFKAEFGCVTSIIPFFSRPEWQCWDEDVATKQIWFIVNSATTPMFPINRELIEFRHSLGQKIWNAKATYCEGIMNVNNSIYIQIGICEYFQVITKAIELEEKIFKAIITKTHKNRRTSKLILPSLESLYNGDLTPTLVGCSVLFVLNLSGEYHVLVSIRSKQTATFSGSLGTLPNYGFTPIWGRVTESECEDYIDPRIMFEDCHSFSTYNFLKECVEELYNIKELDNPKLKRSIYPYWFYELPETKRILEWLKTGDIELKFLGFGFDLLNAGCVIAQVAVVRDSGVAERLLLDIALNWETEDSEASLEYKVLPIVSSELQEELLAGKFHPGAAFTITLANRFLANQKYKLSDNNRI